MKEINLPGSLLGSVQLDVQQHSSKTLSDLVALLQTGSTLKGSVIEVSKGGNVIFTTKISRFSIRLPDKLMKLDKGDKFAFKIEINNNQIFGKIITVNGNPIKATENILLESVLSNPEIPNSNKHQVSAIDLNLNQVRLPATDIKAKITYLNLSHLNKSSMLSKALTLASNGSDLALKIIACQAGNLRSPYSIEGEVLSANGSKQIIKTVFGILTVNQENNLPVGKKIVLEIKSVNNTPVSTSTMLTEVEDFIFKLNNSLSQLENLLPLNRQKAEQNELKISTGSNSVDLEAYHESNSTIFTISKEKIIGSINAFEHKSMISAALQDTVQLTKLINDLKVKNLSELHTKLDNNIILPEQIINLLKANKAKVGKISNVQNSSQNIHKSENSQTQNNNVMVSINTIVAKLLNSSEQKEVIKNLSEDFNKMREFFNIGIHDEDNSKWHNFFLPISDGEKVINNKISINRTANRYIRFNIKLSLEVTGDIELDGLVKLRPNSNISESFDLSIRFKDKLNSEIQAKILELYTLNQNISGITGELNFESIEKFSST